MKVWRIEHRKSGIGPWHHGPHPGSGITAFCTALTRINVKRLHPNNHNTPDKDGGQLNRTAWLNDSRLTSWQYGFKSLKSVRYWFASAKGRRAMAQAGFVLRQYQIDRASVLLGNTQLAFNQKLAILLREQELG